MRSVDGKQAADLSESVSHQHPAPLLSGRLGSKTTEGDLRAHIGIFCFMQKGQNNFTPTQNDYFDKGGQKELVFLIYAALIVSDSSHSLLYFTHTEPWGAEGMVYLNVL